MMKKNHHLEDLAPWYVNQSLSQGEKGRYEAWLEKHPQAKEDLLFWQEMRCMALDQQHLKPRVGILKETQARIEMSELAFEGSWRIIHASLIGLVVAILVFSLLWLTVKPGTTLRWSIHGVEPTSYRIYRAPAGSQLFKLVGEVTAQDNQRVYQYRDLLLFPGRTYQYRVEGINHSGEIAFSQAVVSEPLALLPGQFSILITSMIVGYVCLVVLKSRPWKIPIPTSQVMA